MVTPTDAKNIVRDPEIYGGKPCIECHRIAVHDVATWPRGTGRTPQAIAEGFHLTLAQVHAALAYYFDHQEQIDREIAEEVADIAARAAADTSSVALRLRRARLERRGPLPVRHVFPVHTDAPHP